MGWLASSWLYGMNFDFGITFVGQLIEFVWPEGSVRLDCSRVDTWIGNRNVPQSCLLRRHALTGFIGINFCD